MKISQIVFVTGLLAMLGAAGCGGSKKPVDSLAPFQPEIVNTTDNFQFQATGVNNVTATVSYHWSNSGSQATINHSSTVTGGSVELRMYDANDSLVYTKPLAASANEQSTVGAAGLWRIVVSLANCSGTLNFRAQKL